MRPRSDGHLRFLRIALAAHVLLLIFSACGGNGSSSRAMPPSLPPQAADADGDQVADTADCAPQDATRWQRKAVYRDFDGDGVGSGAANFECVGAAMPVGYVLPGYDPLDDPTNPASAGISTVEVSSAHAARRSGRRLVLEGKIPMKKLSSIGAALLGMCASVAGAAPTTYTFETLTAISMDSSNPSLTGTLRNESTPTTVSFEDITNASFRYVVNRCVPLFITMIEKPGRYYLNVTIDPAVSSVQLISCGLALRS